MEPIDIDEVYRKHGYFVLRRARRILGDEQEAQEVLQEVFVSLVRRPGQFAGRSRITTFLASAATHACLNRIRSRRVRERAVVRLTEEEGAAPAAGTPEGESRVAVRELLASLPEEVAIAAVHFYLDEMTQDEIAEVMGCSRRHVGHLLERLRGTKDRLQAAGRFAEER